MVQRPGKGVGCGTEKYARASGDSPCVRKRESTAAELILQGAVDSHLQESKVPVSRAGGTDLFRPSGCLERQPSSNLSAIGEFGRIVCRGSHRSSVINLAVACEHGNRVFWIHQVVVANLRVWHMAADIPSISEMQQPIRA